METVYARYRDPERPIVHVAQLVDGVWIQLEIEHKRHPVPPGTRLFVDGYAALSDDGVVVPYAIVQHPE